MTITGTPSASPGRTKPSMNDEPAAGRSSSTGEGDGLAVGALGVADGPGDASGAPATPVDGVAAPGDDGTEAGVAPIVGEGGRGAGVPSGRDGVGGMVGGGSVGGGSVGGWIVGNGVSVGSGSDGTGGNVGAGGSVGGVIVGTGGSDGSGSAPATGVATTIMHVSATTTAPIDEAVPGRRGRRSGSGPVDGAAVRRP